MPEVTRTVTIDQPIEHVFERLNDPEFAPQWSGTVESASAEGETHVGQTFEIEGNFLGKSVDMECEVTEHDPPNRYAYRSESPLKMTLSSELQEAGDGTEVAMTIDVDPGRIFAAVGPLFKRQIGKQLEKDLQRLKDLLES